MDKEFLSQCVRDIFWKKQEGQNCLSTRDIVNGLIENFNITKMDIDPYFVDIERALKKCMEEAGWKRMSINAYRQILHNIFSIRLIHFKDESGVWRFKGELSTEQREFRTTLITEAINMVINFYQPGYGEDRQENGLIEMEQLYNNFLSTCFLDCFNVNEFFGAVKEIHIFLKGEGFIEERYCI